MAGIQIDGVNNKIDFDDDADTSISSSTDDTLVVEVGGVDEMTMSSSGIVINEGSNDRDFRVESDGNTHMLFVDGGNNRAGFVTTPDLGHVHIRVGDSGASVSQYDALVIEEDDNCGITLLSGTTGAGRIVFGDSGDNDIGVIGYEHGADAMIFVTNASERMRILSSGELCVRKTSTTFGTAGSAFGATVGEISSTVDAAPIMYINRLSSDGNLVQFHQASTHEGTISVSGSTVSYSGFTGTHWSRLSDNSKPTILRGTIMDSIDEMCDWYQAVADVAEVKYTAEDEEVIDGLNNVGDVKMEAYKIVEPITLPNGKSVGDDVTFTSNSVEYTGTIIKEDDVKHTKSKVSDTADSKKVYGVFSNWDDADDGLDGDVNDMNIAQVGTYIIRVNKDVTVEAGDLLVSNGDGTAKLQDDDIIRSKTVAKVNSNIKVETYSDGSYTVPCTLHC